jgi:RNA polymerase sigma factor (sigma-70 family)
MAATTWADAVTRLGRLCGPDGDPRPDGELLRRFALDRDEAAFRAVVTRHGRLVWGVAVRHAADPHAAEDAFQATFFALARMAGRLREGASLAGWLHTVAVRTARRTRRRAAAPAAPVPEPAAAAASPLDALTARELLAVLDEEIGRLPDRYRQPVLLCCLEGLSRDEAAARLGWGVGAVKGRLERGRELLRKRLVRRGVGLPAALVALVVGPAGASGPLQAATAEAAVRFAAGAREGAAAALAAEVVRAARWRRLPAAALLAVALAAGGVGIAVNAASVGLQPAPAAADPPKDPADAAGAKPADEDPTGPAVRILANGKPAAGAKLWSFSSYHDPKEKPPPAPAPLVAGADGVVRLPASALLGGSPTTLFARDDAGRIGSHQYHPLELPEREITIRLVETTELTGRVVDADGKPLAGVEVATGAFAPPLGDKEEDNRQARIALPPWEVERSKARTDAGGKFSLGRVPAGHLATLRVRSAGYGDPHGAVRVGDPLTLTLRKAGAIRVKFAGSGTAADAKGVQWSVYGVAEDYSKAKWNSGLGSLEPLGGKPLLMFHVDGQFDGSDGSVIPNLAPGKYGLNCTGGGPAPVTGKFVGKIEVPPGGTAEVTVELTRLVKVTGRVIDADTGNPIPDADVSVGPVDRVPDYPNNVARSVKTDADGRYTAHLPAGFAVTATMHHAPAGYLEPEYRRGQLPTPDVKLTDTGHTFPDIKLRKTARFTATVVGADGRPVPATSTRPSSTPASTARSPWRPGRTGRSP